MIEYLRDPRTIPVGRHAVEQYIKRIGKGLHPIQATAAIRDLAASIEREGGKTVYTQEYEGKIVTLVIRDGYVVTCWDGETPPKLK